VNNLTMVLKLKIAVTICAWCAPLLLFPTGVLQWLGFSVPQPIVFLRLLGMAYLALVVSYLSTLRAIGKNVYPGAGVWVGIVSNGGASLCLALAASEGVWSSWGLPAQIFMWGSLVGTAAITVGLVVFGPLGRSAKST